MVLLCDGLMGLCILLGLFAHLIEQMEARDRICTLLALFLSSDRPLTFVFMMSRCYKVLCAYCNMKKYLFSFPELDPTTLRDSTSLKAAFLHTSQM